MVEWSFTQTAEPGPNAMPHAPERLGSRLVSSVWGKVKELLSPGATVLLGRVSIVPEAVFDVRARLLNEDVVDGVEVDPPEVDELDEPPPPLPPPPHALNARALAPAASQTKPEPVFLMLHLSNHGRGALAPHLNRECRPASGRFKAAQKNFDQKKPVKLTISASRA